MNKKTITTVIATIVTICLTAALIPTVSHAAVTPHFVAINDTLLPFNNDTMPYISGGVIFVPYNIFANAGISVSISEEFWRVRLSRGTRRVDFYSAYGYTEDQNLDILDWPSARQDGNKVYVPLNQVCNYFGLTYSLIEVGRNVIPNTQIWVIRVISNATLSNQAFVERNRYAMESAYNAYYGVTHPPDVTETPPPTEEPTPPPTYSDVTIYLSFYSLSEDYVNRVLDVFDSPVASGLQCCFFVTADEIYKNPGLIRMLSGSGCMTGIWLEQGTYREYLETSALLFEAAKIKTVLVSASETTVSAIRNADNNGLIFWSVSQFFGVDEAADPDNIDETNTPLTGSVPSGDTIVDLTFADSLSTVGGDRQNLTFACTELTATLLPGLLTYLNEFEYTVENITETIPPVRNDT